MTGHARAAPSPTPICTSATGTPRAEIEAARTALYLGLQRDALRRELAALGVCPGAVDDAVVRRRRAWVRAELEACERALDLLAAGR